MKSNPSFLAAGLLLALASTAGAATFNFSFGGSSSDGTVGNVRNYTSTPAGVSVGVTAWYTSNNGASFVAGSVGRYSGGLGVQHGSAGDNSHTVDNQGYKDFLLFSFSTPVDINSISFGYVENDSDFKYWIGNSSSVSSLFGTTGASVAGGSSPNSYAINASNIFGSHILVGAEPGSDLDDRFKISAMNVTTRPPEETPGVPDHGPTVALLGLAIAGLAAAKRLLGA